MKELDSFKKENYDVKIPAELEFIVKKSIKKEERKQIKKTVKTIGLTAASIFIIFVGSVNFSPIMAKAMSKVPVLGTLVKLVNIREFLYEDENHVAVVEVPQIDGLTDQSLESSLNEKYEQENKALYEAFVEKIGTEELSAAKLALFKEYDILVQTEDFLVIKAITTEIAASGSESATFDNIDLKNQIIISLPSLFKDDSYIDLISKNIIDQMHERIRTQDGSAFFIEADGDFGGFEKIQANQNYYINIDGNLVICFNEYEVAPGSMGMVEFIIPTEVIDDILVSNVYIK